MKKIITLSMLIITTLFTACQETTTSSSIVDVASLSINEKNIALYSTDAPTQFTANVNYKDTSSALATEKLQWLTSDFNLFSVTKGLITPDIQNGGDANLTVVYKKFTNFMPVHMYKLTSFSVNAPDVNTSGTGTYTFNAYGNFENAETNRSIVSNITWSVNNIIIDTVANGVATITFTTGDTNVTATVFGDTNSSSPIAPITTVFRVN